MSLSQINWSSPLGSLAKKSKTVATLEKNGFSRLQDLLQIFPLRTQAIPLVRPFYYASPNALFRGVGKVIGKQQKINPKIKGKGGAYLTNITMTVQDQYSSNCLLLKWFNLYPSQAQSLDKHNNIYFMGTVSEFMQQRQIISPEILPLDQHEQSKSLEQWQQQDAHHDTIKVTYPTVAGIAPRHLLALINKIPNHLWNQIEDYVPQKVLEKRDLFSLQECFTIIHGKCDKDQLSPEQLIKCHKRLFYNELLTNQIKVLLRKKRKELEKALTLKISDDFIDKHQQVFSYNLTSDQRHAIQDILNDFGRPYPMMRLIQGDVGSGKTAVAILSALAVAKQGYQVALMCPTESLAQQHFKNFHQIVENQANCDLLVGSLDKKTKEQSLAKLQSGETQIAIGTHALIQKDVHFKHLAYAIIDEQHKFGVQQRLDLVAKGTGTHCAIMTATPIPRSLRLTQYGDLDLSMIKELPNHRKGTQTRIVEPHSYPKYLSFLKTRISMGEQAYVVVPAILDNEEQDILNLEQVLKKYHQYFPEFIIKGLHGKMKSQEKSDILEQFNKNKIHIIVSTSVIEVGIDNPNATVIAILGPERFGLSSLHQLRGRVGRGEKKGFCFLVNDKEISLVAKERLNIIEKNTDGFLIADEDLKIRGEGNLFGKEQSGSLIPQLASEVLSDQEILEWAEQDAHHIHKEWNNCINPIVTHYNSAEYFDQVVMTV